MSVDKEKETVSRKGESEERETVRRRDNNRGKKRKANMKQLKKQNDNSHFPWKAFDQNITQNGNDDMKVGCYITQLHNFNDIFLVCLLLVILYIETQLKPPSVKTQAYRHGD